ncbi:MAG: hypothetical protein SGPRY_010082, partial [Prymnesium sp.]
MLAAVVASWCVPHADGATPWLLFTGHTPGVRQHRVVGCLAYYKVFDSASKAAPRARRALHLGRNDDQPGYVLFCLETRRIVCTPHVRLVESSFPGLSSSPKGGEPTADDVFPNLPMCSDSGPMCSDSGDFDCQPRQQHVAGELQPETGEEEETADVNDFEAPNEGGDPAPASPISLQRDAHETDYTPSSATQCPPSPQASHTQSPGSQDRLSTSESDNENEYYERRQAAKEQPRAAHSGVSQHPMGIPTAEGKIPPKVQRANHALDLVIAAARASIYFDQCMTRKIGVRASDVPQKKTQLMVSRDMYPHVHRHVSRLTAFGASPLLDWEKFYAPCEGARWDETQRPMQFDCTLALGAVSQHLGSDFRNVLCEACVDEQCFAAPREVDTDSPTYRQAMSGPEREEWEASNDREIDNLARHCAFEEVPEDTLPTWDARKRRASEVIGILWVLKKKYIDGAFERYKSRAVFDGAEQKKKQLGGVLECFAPTKYESALASRHQVDPELLKTYPRKVGALIYTVPACRVDCAHMIGMLARCLTFPTPEMDQAADRVLVYLAQHADRGITFSTGAPRVDLHACVDSDWAVGHSTSGWAVMFG